MILALKIMHLISGLGGGGAENLLLDIASALQAHVDEQAVIYFTPLDELVPQFKQMGIPVYFVDHEALGSLKSIIKTRALIRHMRPNVVHTHLIRADVLGRCAALSIPGMRCFTTIHNMDNYRTSTSLDDRALSLFDRLTVNHSKRTHLIAVAEVCRQFCIQHTHLQPEKITTLRNFTSSRAEKHGKGITRAALRLLDSDLVLVNAGRLEPQKCQMDILEAAKWLKANGVTDIKFIILGTGTLEHKLRAFIRENSLEDMVRMVGFVSNVYDYFDISDVFLLTSAFEGAPIAVLEAFHNQLPVISSDISAAVEMGTDSGGAIFYPLHDIPALGNLILSVRRGEHDLKAMAERASRYVDRLSPARYVEDLLALYLAHGVRISD